MALKNQDTETAEAPKAHGEIVQLLSWPVMAFPIIACTGSIAQLSAASEYGLGAITIYLIPAVLFMIPSTLISAELATGWNGGVFAWVQEAFGDRLGFQAIWLAVDPERGAVSVFARFCSRFWPMPSESPTWPKMGCTQAPSY